jgi:1,3-beta-glucanosyltransferase GAS5
LRSLSEYGCKETGRTFEEVAALYSSDVTPVFSGGLVYEYTKQAKVLELADYGLVELSSSGLQELEGFNLFRKALAKTPSPSGDGGARTGLQPSTCPPASDQWLVKNNSLPSMPTEAKKYFGKGAGRGQGLQGTNSSQWGGSNGGGLSPSWEDSRGQVQAGKTNNTSPDPNAKHSDSTILAHTGLPVILFASAVVFALL